MTENQSMFIQLEDNYAYCRVPIKIPLVTFRKLFIRQKKYFYSPILIFYKHTPYAK